MFQNLVNVIERANLRVFAPDAAGGEVSLSEDGLAGWHTLLIVLDRTTRILNADGEVARFRNFPVRVVPGSRSQHSFYVISFCISLLYEQLKSGEARALETLIRRHPFGTGIAVMHRPIDPYPIFANEIHKFLPHVQEERQYSNAVNLILDTLCALRKSLQVRQRVCLTPVDLERLRHVVPILEESIESPPTLRALALRLNLNEFKLKYGFKAMHGTTIHAYMQTLRMDRSRILIESGATVTEAALSIGYLSLSKFTRAFRTHFGENPGTFRIRSEKHNLNKGLSDLVLRY